MATPKENTRAGESEVTLLAKQAGFTTPKTVEELFIWRESVEFDDLFGPHTTYRHNAASSLTLSGFFFLTAAAIHPLHWLGVGAWDVILYVAQVLLVGLAILQGVGVATKYVSARRSFQDRVRVRKAASVTETLESLSNPPTIAELFRLNRKQLDEYHVLSVGQQRSSYRAAQVATALAFTVLVFGAIISLHIQGGGAGISFRTYVAGGLTALGTLLSGYIARTFFKTAKDTRDQLNRYYDEPYSTNRLLSVERIVRTAEFGSSAEAQAASTKAWSRFANELSTKWLKERPNVTATDDESDDESNETANTVSEPAASKKTTRAKQTPTRGSRTAGSLATKGTNGSAAASATTTPAGDGGGHT